MSILDSTTLFVAGGLVMLLAGIAFLLDTLLRRNDIVGRLWSVFYLGAMFSVFAFVVGSSDPSRWWAGAIANGAHVTALGFIWAGARRANGRRALLAAPVALGVVVAVASFWPGEADGFWVGAIEMFLAVAIVCLLSAFEFSRGNLNRLLGSRVLVVVLGVMGLFYLGRTIAFLTLGPGPTVLADVFGTEVSTLVEIGFAVIGSIMLASVQGERFAQISEADVEIGARVRIEGILSSHLFREIAEKWLLRAVRERATLVLLLIDVADIAAINTAFGRAAGDAAIRTTGRVVLTQAPIASLVGHLSPRRFAMLLELPANDSVEAIADRIGEGVLAAVIDDQDRFRASTFRGIATTRTSGAGYNDLLAAAVDAVNLEMKAAQESQREDVRGES